MSSASRTLDVAIVGAGIAGLAAALGLRRAGHNVTIYERSMIKDEIGAAITLTPNAHAVLAKWVHRPEDAAGSNMTSVTTLHPESLDPVVSRQFPDLQQAFGHRQTSYHRVDLHSRLRIMAEEAGVQIKLGAGAHDVDCEKGRLMLDNGSTVDNDLVVLADGTKSRFIPHIIGHDVPRRPTGFSVYRTLIPISRIKADKEAWQIFDGRFPGGYCMTSAPDRFVNWMTYPCRNDEMMNVAVFHRTREDQQDAQDWNSRACVDDVLLQIREGFHPAWSALIKLADSVKLFNVSVRDPLPHYSRGKAVLIGDAAHAMQPTHGQGGAMGIEDAGALQVLFSNLTCTDAVEPRLALFNQVRLPRTAVTQLLSNGMFYRSVADEVMSRIREFYSGPLLSSKAQMGFSDEVREYWYGYDALAEAEKALPYVGKESGVPDGVIRHFGRGCV